MSTSLTPGAFLSHGFELYRRNADALWRIAFPLVFVCEALVVVLVLTNVPAGAQIIGGTIEVPVGSSLSAINTAIVVSDALFVLTAVLSSGAMTRLLVAAALGQPESPADALRRASVRFVPLLWISILVFAAIAGGTILLIVPGLYMLGVLSLAVPALMAEDRRGFAALRRSRDLVRGHWWQSFCAALVAGVVTGGSTLLLERGLVLNGSVTSFELARAAGFLIIEIFVVPFSVATIVAIYVDLRAAKEPESMATSFAAGPSSPPAAPAANPWI